MSWNTYVTATNCDRFSLSLNSTALIPVRVFTDQPTLVSASMKQSNLSLNMPTKDNVKTSTLTAVKSTAISSMNVVGMRTADDQSDLFEKRVDG